MLLNRIEAIEKLSSVDAVWDSAQLAFQALGIEFCIYITANQDFEDLTVLSNIPEIYDGRPPAEDPFLKYCCSSYEITRTGLAYLPDHAYLRDSDRAFITRARETGFETGLGIPVRLRQSSRFGGFNLGTRLDRARFEAEIVPHQDALRGFCLMLHRKIEETGRGAAREEAPRKPELSAAAADLLSVREREVATLIARGYSRKECAEKCGLSPNTVSDYMKSIYRKLGISNRVHLARLLERP